MHMRATLWLVVLIAGCGKTLPYADTEGDVDARHYRVVEHPPPPARAETVPARPSETALWIDGAWTWWRGRWSWIVGRWVEPPPNTRHHAWDLCYCPDGKLLYAPGVWRDDTGEIVMPPQPLEMADPAQGAVVDEQGRRIEVGRNVHSQQRYMRRMRRQFQRERRQRRRASAKDVRHHEDCLTASGRSVRKVEADPDPP